MSRKIYHFQGDPPMPGTGELAKESGARGKQRLRLKKAARKKARREKPVLAKAA